MEQKQERFAYHNKAQCNVYELELVQTSPSFMCSSPLEFGSFNVHFYLSSSCYAIWTQSYNKLYQSASETSLKLASFKINHSFNHSLFVQIT